MPFPDRTGRTAILSVRGGWGEGVYRESGSYFQTFHSSNINSKAGPMDPKLYFCIYFGAAFSFNADGKMEQAALPLSAAQQSPRGGWHSLVGIGKGGREVGMSEQRGFPLAKYSTGWRWRLGWGDTHQMPPGCYLKAWLGAGIGKSRA